MSELERQDELRGRLMAALLARGIRRQSLSSEDFADSAEGFDHLFIDMLHWLSAGGFVRYSSIYTGTNGEACVDMIVPTSRGMALLDAKVDGQTGRDIVTASMEGDHSSWSKFGALIGGLFGGFVHSAQ